MKTTTDQIAAFADKLIRKEIDGGMTYDQAKIKILSSMVELLEKQANFDIELAKVAVGRAHLVVPKGTKILTIKTV